MGRIRRIGRICLALSDACPCKDVGVGGGRLISLGGGSRGVQSWGFQQGAGRIGCEGVEIWPLSAWVIAAEP